MSRIADEMLEWIPTEPYIVLELRIVPGTNNVYNIVSIKKYDESKELMKDYEYEDWETDYADTDSAIETAMKVCGVSRNKIRIEWVSL